MPDKPTCEKLLIPHLCTCSVVEFDRSGIVFDRLLVELNGHHGLIWSDILSPVKDIDRQDG